MSTRAAEIMTYLASVREAVNQHRPQRQPYSLWIVTFTDRRGDVVKSRDRKMDEVVEYREVFLRHGRDERFLNRLARAVAKNPRGVRWVNMTRDKGWGTCRMVGR